MPFALIPDGYSLKKVTKLQKQAINSKRRHDNVMAILENSQTPLVVAGIVTAFLAGRAADSLIDEITDDLSILNTIQTINSKGKERDNCITRIQNIIEEIKSNVNFSLDAQTTLIVGLFFTRSLPIACKR